MIFYGTHPQANVPPIPGTTPGMIAQRRNGHLGSTGDDILRLVSAIPGGGAILDTLRSQVEDSARAAIKPYVIGAYVVAGGAAVLSVLALVISIARR